MLLETERDIFEPGWDALVNPVNTIGICGKGLAKEFKDRFPENHNFYVQACLGKDFEIGRVLAFCINLGEPIQLEKTNPLKIPEKQKYIINFPTKTTWKLPSKLSYIESGLHSLLECTKILNLDTISLPALGCGLGGLEFPKVKKLAKDILGKDSNRIFFLHLPR